AQLPHAACGEPIYNISNDGASPCLIRTYEFFKKRETVLLETALAGLTALVVAGVCCRRHFGAIKFVIWLGVWAVLLCMGMFLAVVSVTALVLTAQGKDIPFWDQIPQFLTAGGIVGGILYVFLLPFVVFALKSDLFRERFYGCFRLRGMVQSQASEVVNDWRTT
ncbi:MAG: hypothetical protein ACOYLD_13570, partial [Anaerohalosphaeraceae bacterium]